MLTWSWIFVISLLAAVHSVVGTCPVVMYGDLSKIVPGQSNIAIVTGGKLNSLVARTSKIQSAPESMNSLDLIFKRTDASANIPMTFAMNASTSTPLVMTTPKISISTGNVPLTETKFSMSMKCTGPGTGVFSISFSFSYNGAQCSSFTLQFKKTCGSNAGGTCSNAIGYKYAVPSSTEPAASPKSVTIISYNTHGVVGISAARAGAISGKLNATGASVLALQEVFDPADATRMIDALKNSRYKHIAKPVAVRAGKLTSSGLFFASTYPIVKCSFQEYKAGSGTDALSQKGVSALLLDVGKGRMLYVFNSHLQAGNGSVVRASQLAQAKAYIGTMMKEVSMGGSKSPHLHGIPTQNVGVVLVGDMNVRAGYESDASSEYAKMMGTFAAAGKAGSGASTVFDWTARTGVGYNSTPPVVAAGVGFDWSAWLSNRSRYQRLNQSHICGAGSGEACPSAMKYRSDMAFTTLDYAFGFDQIDGMACSKLKVSHVNKTAFCCDPGTGTGPTAMSDHAAIVVTVVHGAPVSFVATPPPTPAAYWDKKVPVMDTQSTGFATSAASVRPSVYAHFQLAAVMAVCLQYLSGH